MTRPLTLEHAVISLPVLPAQSLPESRGLHPLITLKDGDFTAAVQTCLQGAPEERNNVKKKKKTRPEGI